MIVDATSGRREVPVLVQTQDTSFVDAVGMNCPFCHSQKQEVYEVDASVWAVYCMQCQAVGPHTASARDAIDRWGNRR